MINTGWRKRWLGLGSAFLAFWALVVCYSPPAFTQTKKTVDKKVESPGAQVLSKGAEQIAFIDQSLEKAWKENKLEPAPPCNDFEFIRRVTLDLIGRIAKVSEIDRFLKDPPRERRSLLIERLLASDEFSLNWGNIWTIHLLTRSGSTKVHQEELRDWLAGHFKSNEADWSRIVIDLLTATGKTDENGAVNYILHHMGEEIRQDQQNLGRFDMVPVTSRTTRLFLGLRTQCVQCHDHPFNPQDWKQDHFWGINAFFRQTVASGRPQVMAKKGKKDAAFPELRDDASINPKGLIPYERRSGSVFFTKATFVDGTKLDPKEGNSRRQELAKFITASPYFAKVFVNRTWAHFFGRGMTKDTIDDFGDHNPVMHPELLDKLSTDWAQTFRYNPRDLIRWICNSRAYHLASVANKTNDKPEDEVFFSRMLLKPMSPEQLFESLMIATQSKVSQDKEARMQLRQEWLRKLIVNFGDDEGNEETYNGTVLQALMLMNGKDINDAIIDQENGTVAALLNKKYLTLKDAQKAMNDLFLAALNRPPTAKETKNILLNPKIYHFKYLSDKKNDFTDKNSLINRDPRAFWVGYYQDVFWAILNSNEFILNH